MKKLLKDIKDNNILLEVVDGKLSVFTSEAHVDETLIAAIKAHKVELIAFLTSNGQLDLKDAADLRIPAVATAGNYVLSSSQRRLWIFNQFEENSAAYNMSGVYIFEGALNIAALEYSFDRLLERHESLRTVFRQDAQGEVKQFVLPAADVHFRVLQSDLTKEPNGDEKIRDLVAAEFIKPFNLSEGPLLRAALFQLASDKWIFSYTMHHIISDAWSMNVLIRELLLLYNAFINDESNPLVPLRIQYKDYAAWQQEQLRGNALNVHQAYWLKQFEGELPVLEFPADKVRPATKTYNGAVITKQFNARLSKNLKALSGEQGGTLFMGLLSLVNTLLYRYTGQQDIIIGSSIASREHPELEDQIGFYVNTLPLRARFSGTDSYQQLFGNIKEVTLSAYEHQVYPFDELVDALNVKRDMSRNPLFDAMVVLQNTNAADTGEALSLGNIKVSQYAGKNEVISKFDLTFFFVEVGELLQVNLVYNSDIYSERTITQLTTHLEQLMEAVITHPTVPIQQLDYLTAEEEQGLLQYAEVDYPADKTVPVLFDEQAARVPDQTALVFEKRSLNYKELQEQSNQLAHYLREEVGVKPGDLVGILLDRSEHMIIALLGILKSGAAYVAIDPEVPANRKAFIISDTGIKALLTQSDYIFDLEYYSGNIFAMDIQLATLHTSKASPLAVNQPEDLAYVLYTSGSTGQPKGVMISHRSLVDYYYGLRSRTNINDCKSFGLVSTIAADLGNTVIYSALLSGGALHVFSATAVMQPEGMAGAQLDCLKIVPSHWKALQGKDSLFAPAKCLLFGGEQLTVDVIEHIRNNNGTCAVYNHYGPSEATIGKLLRAIDMSIEDTPISLGTPFGNTRIYILGDELQLLPVGVTGEICIGGDGLSLGYLNQPALTAARFIADPFKPGARIYKTGDLGKWLPDGTVAFNGRKDDQVKIRGYRIELGEISSILQTYTGITAAYVSAITGGSGEKELVAYVAGNEPLHSSDLRSYLSGHIPAYMIPAHFVQLDQLPLTANGKIDRKQLPDPTDSRIHSGVAFVAPRNETEQRLADLWKEVLGKEVISVKDNFFDLGGHSLRLTRLTSLIHKTFEVNVGLKDLFVTLVLEDQAQLIAQAQKTTFTAISPVAPSASGYPLSSSQHMLWVLCQFEEGNIAYNVPAVYVLEGALDVAVLEQSFQTLVARHEILRTVFREDGDGAVKQWVLTPEAMRFTPVYRDLRGEAAADQIAKEGVHAAFITPFNLSTGPLIRAAIYQVADNKWIFTYVTHHIISDGWSKSILINELLQVYNACLQGAGNPLQPLHIQYKDYAAWEQTQLNGEALAYHKNYWVQQFSGELPVLELPGDKVRPPVKTYNGATVRRSISGKLATAIKAFTRESDSTLFMGMLALVKALFYRYSNQEDITIGTPIAGREHMDLENQIGFYVNTLALRTQFKGDNSYRELLEKVKEVALHAYEHQVYPFDRLVHDLQLQRDISRHPLFDVQVIVQNAKAVDQSTPQSLANLVVSGYENAETLTSVFDMVINFVETEDAMHTHIIYNNDVCSENTVNQLATHLEQLLEAVITHPDLPIRQLPLLSASETTQLLTTFNTNTYEYTEGHTLVSLFAQQAKQTPEYPAVVHDGKVLTYQQLEEASDKLAAHLLDAYQVKPDELIGVMMERSEKMIIAILGIMKAGGAYVPINPEYPRERKIFMTQDTGLHVLITQADYFFELDYFTEHIFVMDVQLERLPAAPAPATAIVKPDGLAYVIYTSGSTGDPKGVMIEHGAAANAIQAQIPVFEIGQGNRYLQFCSSSFDVSVFEIFITLLSGAALYIISEEEKKDPLRIEAFIARHSIDIGSIPPAYLKLLQIDKLSTLKKLITGGEAAAPDNVAAFTRSGNYYNAYGPTESSLCTSIYKVTKGDTLPDGRVPVGTPISGVQVYITDEYHNLVPVGAAGEICIGGAGLARGYLNSPELTASLFVPNPFKPGEKMYKTGDMGRWMPDGNIAFIGRKDNQVKVHGHRIELGEIENALQEHPDVDAAIVTAISNLAGDKELVAYIVGKETYHAADLRAWLGRSLPAYMLPGHFVEMDAFPLNNNGKVDRKKLPNPTALAIATGTAYFPPQTAEEKKMVKIWEEVLGKQQIGIRNNFFDLGGDSIKILRMTTAFRKEMQLDIPVTDIYKYNTIEELLGHVLRDGDEIAVRKHQLNILTQNVEADMAALKERILASAPFTNREEVEDIYPMSDIEKGMVYESLADESRGIYHDQLVQRKVLKDFDFSRFRQAVELLAGKHPILRTSFNLNDYETEVQLVHKKTTQPVHYKDISNLTREAQENSIRTFMRNELGIPFKFDEAPLWRLNVFNLGDDEIIFVFQTHHTIIDGWSDASFRTELYNLYLTLATDPLYIPAPLKSSYREYVIQQQISKKDPATQHFWQQELSGFSRLELFTGEDEHRSFAAYLNEEEFRELSATATQLNTTIKAVALGAYLYMLKVLHYDNEIVAGLVTNNRPDYEDGDKILGCFLNTIPLRLTIDDQETCGGFIARVNDKLLALKDYERLSMLEISQLHQQPGRTGNPFFDMIFNYVDFHAYNALQDDDASHEREAGLPELKVGGFGRTNTHLDFTVNVTAGKFKAGFSLTKKLKAGFSAEKLGALYFSILKSMVHAPEQPVYTLLQLSAAEKQLLATFNNTASADVADKTLAALFEEQVAKTPDAIALLFEETSLSYRELNERANQLAAWLRAHYKIKVGDLVGVKLERSEWLVVTLLGILKSGAAYVPIDPAYPEERVEYLLSDSNCKEMIDVRELSKFQQVAAGFSTQNPVPVNKVTDLAYVIYTSGSTGQPKGVMIEHRSVHTFINWCRHEFGQADYDVVFGVTSICFDLSVFEIFYTLSAGKQLRLLDNALSVPRYLNTTDRVLLNTVPSVIATLLSADTDFRQVKVLNMAGEPIPAKILEGLAGKEMEIRNLYGPSEDTTYSTMYRIKGNETVLIGAPIADTQIHILDENGQEQPVGIAGEICIAGAGLARGYLNKPLLTAEKFVENPFRKGTRMYKTGDLGRWLPDGNIAYIGRKDNQVKVRGYRIELGEIEAALESYPGIEKAVVVAWSATGDDKELVAYLTGTADITAIRNYMEKLLPAYMLPGHYMQLAAIPLTANGKTDRRQLPAPATASANREREYVAPRNETEEKLVLIWQELLGKEKIGVHDSFFELGGHSLKIMKMLALIHREFNVKLKLKELFNKTNIEDISKEITREIWVKSGNEDLVSDQSFIL
jgi:amino acid adenylation domain-containing protein